MQFTLKTAADRLQEKLEKMAANDPELTELNLGLIFLFPFFLFLRSQVNLLMICVASANLGPKDAKFIGKALKKNTHIVEVDLCVLFFVFQIIIFLFDKIQNSLADNRIGEEIAKILSKILEKNTTITSVDISSSKFLFFLRKTNSHLNLKYQFDTENRICDEGALFICQALKNSTNLTKLNLSSYSSKIFNSFQN